MKLLWRLLFVSAGFSALNWIIFMPIWQYPDEQAHFAQVQDTAEIGKIRPNVANTSYEIVFSEKVLGTERDTFGNNKFTYHPEYKLNYTNGYFGEGEKDIKNLPKSTRAQLVKSEATLNPPLYYLITALVYRIFYDSDLFTRVYTVRFFSLILFLMTIFVAYKIGQEIFSTKNILAITLSSLIAFKPMFVFASTGILPDPLTNLLFFSVLLLCLKIVNNNTKTITYILLVLLIILGVMTRQHFLIAIIFSILATLYKIKNDLRRLGKIFIVIFCLTGFIYFATFATSIPVISLFRLPEVSLSNLKMIKPAIFLSNAVWILKHSYREVLPWYWGVYKWLSLTLPPLVYKIVNRLILIAIIGLLLKIAFIVKNRKAAKEYFIFSFLLFSSIVYYVIFLLWDDSFQISHGFSFGIQGRYFFPLVGFHLALLLIGFWQILELIFNKYAKYGLFILVFLMVIFNDFSISFVISSYYTQSGIINFIKEASQYKPDFLKGEILLVFPLVGLLFQSFFLFNFLMVIKRSRNLGIALGKKSDI